MSEGRPARSLSPRARARAQGDCSRKAVTFHASIPILNSVSGRSWSPKWFGLDRLVTGGGRHSERAELGAPLHAECRWESGASSRFQLVSLL